MLCKSVRWYLKIFNTFSQQNWENYKIMMCFRESYDNRILHCVSGRSRTQFYNTYFHVNLPCSLPWFCAHRDCLCRKRYLLRLPSTRQGIRMRNQIATLPPPPPPSKKKKKKRFKNDVAFYTLSQSNNLQFLCLLPS